MANDTPASTQTRRLGEMLLQDGIISEGQLQEALASKQKDGGFIGKILIDMRYLDEHTLINYLVKQFKIPHISLLDYEIAEDVIKILPKEICLEYNLVPIDKLGKILTIAMVDPLDAEALEKVREAAPEVRIKPILCSWQHFEHVIRNTYPDDFTPPHKQAGQEGTTEVSMESLGLTSRPEKKKKEPKPEPGPAPTDSTRAVARKPPDANEIMDLVDATIQSAMEEAVAHLATSVRAYVQASDGELPVSAGDLAARVRTAIGEAAETAGSGIVQETKTAIEQAGKSASEISALELSQMVDSSIRRALSGMTSDVIAAAARDFAAKAK